MGQQQTLITRPRYADPMADAQFRHAQDTLLTIARTQAQADGSINLPVSETEYRARFANGVFTHVQQCLDEHAQLAQNVSGVLLANQIGQAAKEKVRLLQAVLTEEQIQCGILRKEMEHIKPNAAYNLIRFLVAAGLVIIACSEGILSYPCFRSAALPTYSALIAACGIAIAVAIGAPLGAAYIRKSLNRRQFVIRTCLAHAGFLGLFYFLSILRLHQYNAAASFDADASEISAPVTRPDCTTALSICITSFALFSLALFACIRFHKSRAESGSEQEYNDKKEKADTLAGSIARKEREIAYTRSRCAAEQAEALASYEFAVGHQKRLIGLGKKALNLYGATNIRFRSDGLCPAFFSHPPEHNYTSVFIHAMEPAS